MGSLQRQVAFFNYGHLQLTKPHKNVIVKQGFYIKGFVEKKTELLTLKPCEPLQEEVQEMTFRAS